VPRASAKPPRRAPPRLPADPRLLEIDLKTWAGEGVARRGRQEALLGRVEFLRLTPDGKAVDARVRGSRTQPYSVRIAVGGEGTVADCTCGRESGPVCEHAVAALEALRFPNDAAQRVEPRAAPRRSGNTGRGRGRIIRPARGVTGYLVLGGTERMPTRDERVEQARQEEIVVRRQRARRERRRVTREAGAHGPPVLLVAGRGRELPARVTLRGLDAALASCDCDDFAVSELRTCKHVERTARSKARRAVVPPDDVLSVWWLPRSRDQAPDPLQEIRVDAPGGRVPAGLAERFGPDGWLQGGDSAAASAAVEEARRLAADEGLIWDLDPRVTACIEQAARRQRRNERLRVVEEGSELWRRVRGRIGFDLHRYQEEGALFLARRGRAFLADDMGLGKTVQAIFAALLLRETVAARRTLVVCPASLKYQWRREIELACGERAQVVDGPPGVRAAAYREWDAGFLILNYELVLRDLERIQACTPDLIVLDEAQRIKNWDTKTARAVKRLRSPHAFILTGTPLENRLLELHSLAEFLHPRALGPRWRLLPFHAVTDTTGRVLAYEGLDVLRARLRGFFLRRERSEVADQLPERTDNTFWTGMTPLQRKPYRRHAAQVAALVANQRPLRPADVRILLQALTRMRILCNSHAQYDWSRLERRVAAPEAPTRAELKALGSPKLEEFARVLDDLLEESGKVVVFSQWERMLRLAHFVVRELLARRELRGEVFHGGLSARARNDMIDAFRREPEFRVLFSTDAGGLGLNLQEAASIVVNLEVPWNPAVLEQRIGRVHRLGQRRTVQVLHFVTRGAVEERVRQVVESKKALFEGLLDEQTDRVVFDESRSASWVRRVCDLLESDAPA
jgi:superfamily II DNA or RNA helicase